MADLGEASEPATSQAAFRLHPRRSRGWQVALRDLFLLTTATAILVCIFLWVSRMAALFGAGNLLAFAVFRWTGFRNVLLGGLIGFLISAMAACGVMSFGRTTTYASISLLVICPAAGYVVGACLAELQNLSDV